MLLILLDVSIFKPSNLVLKKTTNNSLTTDILDFQGLLFLKPRAGTRKDGISKRKDHLPTIHFQIFCCKFQLGTVAPPKNRLDMDHGTSSQKSWFPFSGPPKIMTSYAKKRSSCTSQNDVKVPQPVLQITGQTRVEIDVFWGGSDLENIIKVDPHNSYLNVSDGSTIAITAIMASLRLNWCTAGLSYSLQILTLDMRSYHLKFQYFLALSETSNSWWCTSNVWNIALHLP